MLMAVSFLSPVRIHTDTPAAAIFSIVSHIKEMVTILRKFQFLMQVNLSRQDFIYWRKNNFVYALLTGVKKKLTKIRIFYKNNFF